MADVDRLKQQLDRQADTLEEAADLLRKLCAKAIKREAFDLQMVMLEETNRDIPILTDARQDPANDGKLITDALADVRRQLDELTK